MNDDLGFGLRDQARELHFVVHIADHGNSAHSLELRNAIGRPRERDDFVPGVQEQRKEDAPDCARPTGDENVHR
jgi:hypothetical protein